MADRAVIAARLRDEREKCVGSRPDLARRMRQVSLKELPEVKQLVDMIKQWENDATYQRGIQAAVRRGPGDQRGNTVRGGA